MEGRPCFGRAGCSVSGASPELQRLDHNGSFAPQTWALPPLLQPIVRQTFVVKQAYTHLLHNRRGRNPVTEVAPRAEAFALAAAVREYGHPHLAIVPLVRFEWLQRPENVLGGHLRWSDSGLRNGPPMSGSCATKPGRLSGIRSKLPLSVFTRSLSKLWPGWPRSRCRSWQLASGRLRVPILSPTPNAS